MIGIYQGLPGSGKSMLMARTLVAILYRNRKYEKKTGIKRKVYHNLQLCDELKKEFSDLLEEWSEPAQLTRLRNVDVFWDEVATHLDATQWANMSLELKRWLQQHRKFGIEIYGTTQDFAQVDISFRRLCSHLRHLVKLCGSRDVSATKPPPKFIWGLIIGRDLDPVQYNEAKSKFAPENIIPKFYLLHRNDIEIYDTTAEVKTGAYPPLRHIERKCEHCDHLKISHV